MTIGCTAADSRVLAQSEDRVITAVRERSTITRSMTNTGGACGRSLGTHGTTPGTAGIQAILFDSIVGTWDP